MTQNLQKITLNIFLAYLTVFEKEKHVFVAGQAYTVYRGELRNSKSIYSKQADRKI